MNVVGVWFCDLMDFMIYMLMKCSVENRLLEEKSIAGRNNGVVTPNSVSGC